MMKKLLGVSVLLSAVSVFAATAVPAKRVIRADGLELPPAAVTHMPILKQSVAELWPDMPLRSYFGAQIEQETCMSLTHRGCWNSKTELKTSREYGFGIGQVTVAYNADGSERFNTFKELTKHEELKNWKWEDRYNIEMQMKGLIIKNKVNWSSIRYPVADFENKMAFLAVAYNAGMPILDIRLCKTIPGCDPTKWWGNVEKNSTKSKIAVHGYSKSFFQISREYPNNLLHLRRPKYIPHLDKE